MNLPNGDRASVPVDKLEGYCLNAEHPSGQHKARVFRSVLAITVDNADILRAKLREVARRAEATARPPSVHGQGYEVRFRMTGPNGNSADVVSGWFIDAGAENPRLTSCYIDI